MTLKDLLDDLAAKSARADAIKAMPDDAIDDDVITEGNALPGQLKDIKARIEDMRAARLSASTAADDAKAFIKTPVLSVPKPQAQAKAQAADDVKAIDNGESEDDKYIRKGPFHSLGHFAASLRQTGGNLPCFVTHGVLGEWNGRVTKVSNAVKAMPDDVKAVTGMSELTDPDGAAFVPLDIAAAIWERSLAMEENLLGLVDSTPVSGNGYKVHAWNDKTRTSGTLYGGARAYWGAEGSQGTNVKPATRDIEFKLNKLTVLMPVTEELLEDAVALDSRLQKVAAACFSYEINKGVIRGDGAGKPLGILNAAALINVAAVSSQGVNTIVGANVTAMFSRRPPGSDKKMVWLYNQDIEPQLDQLNFTAGSTAAQWMYLTAGGLRDSPGDPMLKGRRMIASEHCSALGTQGDLILWDPSSYGAIVKTSGIKQAVSMHLRFDYGEAVFRWAFRFDGRCYWDDVLTPANGGTRAPIVTLNSSRT